jgi:predicted ATP-grasp superfamily ATP-dependent carboligase
VCVQSVCALACTSRSFACVQEKQSAHTYPRFVDGEHASLLLVVERVLKVLLIRVEFCAVQITEVQHVEQVVPAECASGASVQSECASE